MPFGEATPAAPASTGARLPRQPLTGRIQSQCGNDCGVDLPSFVENANSTGFLADQVEDTPSAKIARQNAYFALLQTGPAGSTHHSTHLAARLRPCSGPVTRLPHRRRHDAFSTSELVAGLGAGLDLGRADTLSFVSVVVALYLVPKGTELFCVNVRVKLDNQGALSVSIAPKLTGGRSSSLVGAPSTARSSISLLPISESAGLPAAAERAGSSSEEVAVTAGRAGGSSEMAAAATAAASVADAGGVVRGRVETTLFAD